MMFAIYYGMNFTKLDYDSLKEHSEKLIKGIGVRKSINFTQENKNGSCSCYEYGYIVYGTHSERFNRQYPNIHTIIHEVSHIVQRERHGYGYDIKVHGQEFIEALIDVIMYYFNGDIHAYAWHEEYYPHVYQYYLDNLKCE